MISIEGLVEAIDGPLGFIAGRKSRQLGKDIEVEKYSTNPDKDNWLPILGKIGASPPNVSYENLDYIFAPQFCGKSRYGLEVSGESMIDMDIFPKNVVILEPTSTPINGDIVVAIVDSHEATLKQFYYHEDGVVELRPKNKLMKPIFYSAERVQIQAKMVWIEKQPKYLD